VVKTITGLRVDEEHEDKGLDISLHEERGFVLTE
jgi:ammonia channel protein AmtB